MSATDTHIGLWRGFPRSYLLPGAWTMRARHIGTLSQVGMIEDDGSRRSQNNIQWVAYKLKVWPHCHFQNMNFLISVD